MAPCPLMRRYEGNPVLAPRPGCFWEAGGTFNPAVFRYGGKIYMVYRQVSRNCVSTLGLAVSRDGYEFLDRMPQPVYVPRARFETHPEALGELRGKDFCSRVASFRHVSGASCFGVEDPRIALMNNRIYLTYVAFNGVDPPRGALTWIDVVDFLNERWDMWAKPIPVTHPSIPDKSVVMLPRRVRGKIAFFHRIFPHVWLDYVDDVSELTRRYLWGYPAIRTRPPSWDSRKIGVGSVVEWGPYFLATYYGVTGWDDYYYSEGLSPRDFAESDGYRYKIGVMVLDGEDPSRVLYRSPEPVAEPEAWYELHEPVTPNVIYPTGSLLEGEKLLIYYGASDYFVALGELDLGPLRDELSREL
ncbi:MAG: hypothetical protein QXU97_05495 [Fervidicoccaceae archaeon]